MRYIVPTLLMRLARETSGPSTWLTSAKTAWQRCHINIHVKPKRRYLNLRYGRQLTAWLPLVSILSDRHIRVIADAVLRHKRRGFSQSAQFLIPRKLIINNRSGVLVSQLECPTFKQNLFPAPDALVIFILQPRGETGSVTSQPAYMLTLHSKVMSRE